MQLRSPARLRSKHRSSARVETGALGMLICTVGPDLLCALTVRVQSGVYLDRDRLRRTERARVLLNCRRALIVRIGRERWLRVAILDFARLLVLQACRYALPVLYLYRSELWRRTVRPDDGDGTAGQQYPENTSNPGFH